MTNSGTLDTVISNINVVTDNNPAIIYTTSELQQGDKITKNGDKKYLTVKIEYDSNVTSQPAIDDNDITIQMDYQQDLGQFDPISYNAYSIGDTINFAGSNWRVIANSSSEEDYVTLMKETVLTNAELGEYAYNGTYDTMEYTWTDMCHWANHGYSSSNTNNCSNTNSYAASKVKEMLETRYLPTIGAGNLKEINGYKIRLITLEELQQNLGVSTTINASWYDVSTEDSLSWVYQSFGDQSKNVLGYWTMTSHPNYSSVVWGVGSYGMINENGVNNYNSGVRPIINLLKSAIQ